MPDATGGFDIPQVLLPEIAALHARAQPAKPALICDGVVLSWGALDDAVAREAAGLARRGIGRGSVVAVLADPSIPAIVAELAVLRAGAAVASLPPTVTPDALARMVGNAGAALLIADAQHRDALCAELPEALREGALVLGHGDSTAPGASPAPNDRDDPFVILYSSGTTGLPKGIVLSHGCRLANAQSMAIEMRYDNRAVALIGTSLASNMTWTLLTTSLMVGGTAVVMRRFDAAQAVALIAEHGITHTTLVPTQWAMLLDAADAVGASLASLRTATSVGSSIPPGLKRRMAQRLAGRCCEVYGLTEGLVTVLKPEDWPTHIDTVGRPLLGHDIRIIDAQGGECPTGERGEIVGHSPVLMRGYRDDPAGTEAVIWREPATGRSFLRSGDIGFLDSDGFLHLVDRLKDMIVSGGANIYPADLERVLLAHDAVREAAVVGVTHAKWGETPVALVVLQAEIDAEALRLWANARLGRQQKLARVLLRDALPRNAGGKVLKRALRDSIQAEVAS